MRVNAWAKIFILLLILSFQAAQANYGTRPLGMGGAFTAISNDANAAYYNPAGLALNPGIDFSGSTLLTNRNEKIGDNSAAFKMCFEVPMNPFTWIMGVGMASMLAYSGAKYLYDEGIIKKNWGRNVEKSSKDESVSEKVEQSGSEKKEDIKKEVKETVKKAVGKGFETAVDLGKETARAALRNPWYYSSFNRPTYWDRRESVEEGKAQFALGVSWIFDKNAEKNQNTNWYSLTLASGYAERIALGANINIYDLEIPSVKARGLGGALDLGVIARPVDQVAFGASIKDILTTDIHFSNGVIVTYGMNFNAGIALIPISELTFAADMHNIFQQNGDNSTLHYGIEYRPIPGAAIRAGLSDGSKTAGLSFAIGPLIFDYAYLGGSFNRTQLFGATWKI